MASGSEDKSRRRLNATKTTRSGHRNSRHDSGQLMLPFDEARSAIHRWPRSEDHSGHVSSDAEKQPDQRHGRGEDNGKISIEFSPLEPSALTAGEAIRYLRLDVGKTPEAARASLDRIVEKGLLRPCMYRKERMFTRAELDRFLADQTARYGDV